MKRRLGVRHPELKLVSAGFTIVETMVFLAISTALLISASVLFAGTQRRNQFHQSMRDVESKFQDIINDVSTGYFEFGNATCTGNPGNFPTFTNAPSALGTNKGCVFFGKSILLTPGGNNRRIDIIPIVGNRVESDGRDSRNLLQAYAVPVCCSAGVNFTQSYEILWGAEVNWAAAGGVDSYAASLIGSATRYDADDNVESGAQKVIRRNHDIPINSQASVLDACYRAGESDPPPICINPPWVDSPWIICFTNGDQDARLTIGGNTSLTTTLEFISCRR